MSTADKRFHIIYRTVNLVTGEYYTGMHSTDDLDDGYLGTGSIIKEQIDRYGRECFRRTILEHLPSREALKQREAQLITPEMLRDPKCMNVKFGGDGGWDHITPEQQRVNGLKGQARMKHLRELAGMTAEEALQRLAQALIESRQKKPTPQQLAIALEEHAEAQRWVRIKALLASESMKKAYADGTKKPVMPNWTGRKHSPETRAKISAARKKN